MSECTCKRCQGYCQHKPGMYAPGEAERTAELLGLTLQELFEHHLVAEFWTRGDDEPTWFLAPAVVGGPTGGAAPFETHGACVFYQRGRCAIHKAKPHECRVTDHRGGMGYERRREMADRWAAPEHQAQVAALAREPLVMPEPTLVDVLALTLREMLTSTRRRR